MDNRSANRTSSDVRSGYSRGRFQDQGDDMEVAERLARLFHAAYETHAPSHGYETRQATRVPWDELPDNNRNLMLAAVREALEVSGVGEVVLRAQRLRSQSYDGDAHPVLTNRLQLLDEALAKLEAGLEPRRE